MSDFATRFGPLDEQRICELLARTRVPGSGDCEVTVGLLIGTRVATGVIKGTGETYAGGNDAGRGPLGCVTKILTGLLAMGAAREGRLTFGQHWSTQLGGRIPGRGNALEGITVRDLLRHSHGLDVSGLERLARCPDGFIDLPPLCDEILSSHRLFAPGSLYSYSNAGAWLTAALLEQAYSLPYPDLLLEQVLRPAGITARRDASAAHHWCPATGADLSLSVPELLQVMHWFLCQPALYDDPELRNVAAPPGWCLESGACAGWKFYGSGWYGHNMVWERHSLVVRVQPEQKVAIVAAAIDASASMSIVRMIGHLLPEYRQLRMPRLLPQSPHSEVADTTGLCGTYANRVSTVRVSFGEGSGLQATISANRWSRAERPPDLMTELRPGTDRAFLAGTAAAAYFQWVQFVSPGTAGFMHLWDGKSLLRRI